MLSTTSQHKILKNLASLNIDIQFCQTYGRNILTLEGKEQEYQENQEKLVKLLDDIVAAATLLKESVS